MPSYPEEFFVRKDAKVIAMWLSSTEWMYNVKYIVSRLIVIQLLQ